MVAPRGDVERRLAHIWQEILAVDAVGVDDGFFDLGGDSLLLVEMQQRLAARFSTDVPVTALFEHPTIRSLAGSGLFGESGSVAPDRPAHPGRSGASRLGVRRRRRETRREAG
jgi:acyl carrier protein